LEFQIFLNMVAKFAIVGITLHRVYKFNTQESLYM